MKKRYLIAGLLLASGCNGSSLLWVNQISQSGGNTVTGVAHDASGNLYITGTTTSASLPLVNAAQKQLGGPAMLQLDGSAAAPIRVPGVAGVLDLAANPQNSLNLYTVAANAISVTSDGGQSWTNLANLPAADTFNSIAINSSGDTLYLSTTQSGIYKSTDGGASWLAANAGLTTGVDGFVRSLRTWTDPANPSVIFADLNTGLFRSADRGATWTKVLDVVLVYSLGFDPTASGTIYVAPSGGRLMKSTDDGVTWTAFGTQPSNYTFQAIAADPTHPGRLYAGIFPGLFRSDDAGSTWVQKALGTVTAIVVAASGTVYAAVGSSIEVSTDGFDTSKAIGPAAITAVTSLRVAGAHVFAGLAPDSDVFVTKLDVNGNVVYSTYFGGSSFDSAAAIATGTDGAVYVTGKTSSLDFPVTNGAYASKGSSFVFKLNPDGTLGWATYFADSATTPRAIAVDASGEAVVVGTTLGNLPTTAGAYQPNFSGYSTVGSIVPLPSPTNGFATKFNANGSALAYSTYFGTNYETGAAIVLDSAGEAYVAGSQTLYLFDASFSSLLASTQSPGTVTALALDGQGSLYATGVVANGSFAATAGAFQTSARPKIPILPGAVPTASPSNAFVAKYDGRLAGLLAATLLGGEGFDEGQSLTIDPKGNVIVTGFTQSKYFPTVGPQQGSFSSHSGFVSELSGDLSRLLFSTFVGDTRPYGAFGGALDSDGNFSFAGSSLVNGSGVDIIAAKITLGPPQNLRIDSVVNAASMLADAIAPGEAIVVLGSGFPSDSVVMLNGAAIPVVSRSSTSITALVPANALTNGTHAIQVSTSNVVLMPAIPAMPAIFSVDGSGTGQSYVLNADGATNSLGNPAKPGDPITIFVNGANASVNASGYAFTAQTVAVFIDGIYANGIASVLAPAPGLPGTVYQIGVYTPATTIQTPTQVSIRIEIGGVRSQNGLALSVQ